MSVEYHKTTAVHERGEFTVVVGPRAAVKKQQEMDVALATTMVACLAREPEIGRAKAEEFVSKALGVEVSELRKGVKKYSIMVKRQSDASS
jgi:hypothetical protein